MLVKAAELKAKWEQLKIQLSLVDPSFYYTPSHSSVLTADMNSSDMSTFSVLVTYKVYSSCERVHMESVKSVFYDFDSFTMVNRWFRNLPW